MLLWLLFTLTVRSAPPIDDDWEPPERLSAYGLFRDAAKQEPADGVMPYDLNTPLFSDYTTKYRFVKLPAMTSAKYHATEAFEFPVGTVIAKTFAMPRDLRDAGKGRRLLETRLLVRKPDGWVGLPYLWDDGGKDAKLDGIGGTRDVTWTHSDGKSRSMRYIIPNKNQCMSCHENERVMRPIGPKARHLNRDNQLAKWAKAGLLTGLPGGDKVPRAAVWNDPKTGTLDQRARAYLDINCAHCHNPAGPARTSGLDLLASQSEGRKWGLLKPPIAAGKGTGGRKFDVVPGKPDESILVHRMESTEVGVMMPELPRRLVDDEGVALIREWIAKMKE